LIVNVSSQRLLTPDTAAKLLDIALLEDAVNDEEKKIK